LSEGAIAQSGGVCAEHHADRYDSTPFDAAADGTSERASRRAVRLREGAASIRLLINLADSRQNVH
jgi:hypothetical protein